MFIINYDDLPNKSIFYLSAMLYKYIKTVTSDYKKVREYFILNLSKNELLFFYSLDWLYLLGKVIKIKEGKIICV